MATENTAWQLEDFVDTLVVELDKTRETLAIKAINKPLSYTVKDLALDLNIFPSYDGDQVRFITAQPGQEGASKVSIQLGSITDQQVRATTKIPGSKDDIPLEQIDVDKETKKELRKMGVSSVEDLQKIEQKNVDLGKVTDNAIDYTKLANQIQKSRRSRRPPRVRSASLSLDESQVPYLLIQGENLAVDPRFQPVAVVNQTLAEILSSSDTEVRVQLPRADQLAENNEVILTCDPYALVKMNLKVRP
jgi:hypothetical protein